MVTDSKTSVLIIKKMFFILVQSLCAVVIYAGTHNISAISQVFVCVCVCVGGGVCAHVCVCVHVCLCVERRKSD